MRIFEDFQVIIRVLKGPIGFQADSGAGQLLIDHAIGVAMDGCGHFLPVGDIHQHGASRFSAKIDTNCVFFITHCVPPV